MPINTIVESLLNSRELLEDFLDEISSDQLDKRLKTGGWSIRDHAVHLMDVQPMINARLEQFLQEEHPILKPFNPDQSDLAAKSQQIDLSTMLETWTQQRIHFARHLQLMTAEQLRKTAQHPEYTLYTPLIMARHILLHDHLHMYRMEAIWLTRESI